MGSAERLTASLTVLASDDPYGVFVVASDSRRVDTPSAFTGNSTGLCNPFIGSCCAYNIMPIRAESSQLVECPNLSNKQNENEKNDQRERKKTLLAAITYLVQCENSQQYTQCGRLH